MKNKIIEKFREHDKDTGSSKVQIAILTSKIEELNGHLSKHPHDNAGRRGLMKLVGKRRRLSKYMQLKNPQGYKELIGELGLRK